MNFRTKIDVKRAKVDKNIVELPSVVVSMATVV